MNNTEISHMLKSHWSTRNIFEGTFAIDTLPLHPRTKKPCGYICNTESSKNSGEHWLAIYFPKRGPTEYFDSYGLPINSLKMKYFVGHRFKRNKLFLQSPYTTVCGQYCLLFIYMKSIMNIEIEAIGKLLMNISTDSEERDHKVNSIVEHIYGQDLDVLDTSFVVEQFSRALENR